MRLFVDSLTNIDFSYLDIHRGLVGETWLANIELEGTLDDQGMVCDFGIVKKKLREWLDTHLDHCLLVPKHSDNMSLRQTTPQTTLNWRLHDGSHIETSAPEQAITLVDSDQINPDTVAAWCTQKLQPLFPTSVIKLHLNFSHENITSPFYHYSHGLKKHAGNCQRIAHGHRSKIEIWRNGEYSLADIQQWADRWQDIYIGTHDDICDTTKTHYTFAYKSQQGLFSLTIPRSYCYLIDTDSTVELIAQHLAEQLKQQYPQEEIIVKAYEGIGKGAKAISA